MTLPTRELSITYGTFVVGGSQTNRVLRDIHILDDAYEGASLEYEFTIKQTSDASFITECDAVEDAFRIPHLGAVVSLNSAALKTFSPSDSSGFGAEPQVLKRGKPSDSIRTRTYTVRIKFQRPADNTSSSGRRITKTAVNVSYTPARRRTVTISGEYTPVSGTSGRSNYTSGIDAYATSVLNALGGTYKLLEEPTSDSGEAGLLRFSRSYEEIIFTGVGAGDADLRKETCIISRNKVGPGDTPSADRLVTLNVQYEAWFNKENVTDIVSKWPGLLSSIVAQATTILTGGAVALINEDPNFDLTDNRISATLTLQGSTQGGLLENRVTTEVESLSGLNFVPVWNKGVYDRFIYQGPATQRKTVTIVQKSLASAGGGGGGGGGGAAPGTGNGAPGAGASFGGGIVNNGGGSISLPGGSSINIFGGPMTGAQITALVNAVLSDGDPSGGGGGQGGGGGGGGLGGFYPVSNSVSVTPIRLGQGQYTFDITETTIVTVWERADPVGVGGGVASG